MGEALYRTVLSGIFFNKKNGKCPYFVPVLGSGLPKGAVVVFFFVLEKKK